MAAHVVEQKGSADQWAVQRILDDIRMIGHTNISMMGDGEPALVKVKVQREIVDKTSAGSVPQNPRAYDPTGQRRGRARRERVHGPDACDEDRAGAAHPDEDRPQLNDCPMDGRGSPNTHQPVPCWTRRKDAVCEVDGKEQQQEYR